MHVSLGTYETNISVCLHEYLFTDRVSLIATRTLHCWLALLMLPLPSQAHQDVPEFLEQAAEEAVGSNYGPQGGRFGAKDMRVSESALTVYAWHFLGRSCSHLLSLSLSL